MQLIKTHWLFKPLTYDGTQLKSKWIQDVSGLEGNVFVAFSGPADVPIENMVDLEDVARNAPIFSESMLHFIIEIFDKDLEKMVLRQRLLIAVIHETLLKFLQLSHHLFPDFLFSIFFFNRASELQAISPPAESVQVVVSVASVNLAMVA